MPGRTEPGVSSRPATGSEGVLVMLRLYCLSSERVSLPSGRE